MSKPKWTQEAAIEAGVLLAAGAPHYKSREWVELALSYDPFCGDFGDGTERVIKDELAVARRGGKCMCGEECCGSGRVVKGTLTRVIRRVDSDGWYGGRACVACLDAEAQQAQADGEDAKEVLDTETDWTEDDGWGE